MRKASLNLSVNAIIIFVLAFAMLGVGIYVTNEMRDLSGGGIDRAREIIASIEEEPTAEKPLVGVTKDLDIRARQELATGIRFYNAEKDALNDTIVVIDKCKPTDGSAIISLDDGTGEGYPVTVVSDTVKIEPSTFEDIPFVVRNERLSGGEKYICKLLLIQEDSDPTVEYYSHSFFLNVRS